MKKRPNIIWIISDQQSAHTLACNGDPNSRTPNLDLMAGTGWNFNCAVSGYPLCCPFRGALISGRYPHKCVPGHEKPLDPKLPTIADVFNQENYDTAYFGKWHLAGPRRDPNTLKVKQFVPHEHRGRFNTWLGYECNNQQYKTYIHGHTNKGQEIPITKVKGYDTDIFTDLLLDYVKERCENHKDEPFFAVLSVQPPHNPYEAPPEYLQNYRHSDIKLRPNVMHGKKIRSEIRQNLVGAYAMIENLDHNIGRVRTLLREQDIDDDTYIFFFSDHGDQHGSHGQFLKTIAYEESIRIPFIVVGGAEHRFFKFRSQGQIDSLINHVDIAPTTLGVCDIPIPEWMDGYDYSPRVIKKAFVYDESAEPQEAYLQNVIPTKHGESCDRPYRGIVTKDGWKYVCTERDELMLFDLNNDPYEERNLVMNTIALKKRHELHQKLEQWIKKTEDNFKLPSVYS